MENFSKMINTAVNICEKYYKKPKFWIMTIILLGIFVLLIPYIDSNFFYFSRMEKRIEILEKVMSLDQEKIMTNEAYINEYESILEEMKQQEERFVNSVINKFIDGVNWIFESGKGKGNNNIKFLVGAGLSWLLAFCVPFIKTFNDKSEKVIGFCFMIILGIVLGILSIFVPIIITPMVNYIAIPIIEIILLNLVSVKKN